jgi:hypothetical protein
MRRLLFAVLLVMPIAAATAAEGTVGQYSIILEPQQSGSKATKAFILDTKNGHLWEWVEDFSGANPDGFQAFIYKGQVVPGKNTGPDGAKTTLR